MMPLWKSACFVAFAGAALASVSFANAKGLSVHSQPSGQASHASQGSVRAPAHMRASASFYGNGEVGRIRSVVAPQRGWTRPIPGPHREWRRGGHDAWPHAAAQRPRIFEVGANRQWRVASATYASAGGVYVIGGSYDPPPRARPAELLIPQAVYSAAPQIVYGDARPGRWRSPVPVVYGVDPAGGACDCAPAVQPARDCLN